MTDPLFIAQGLNGETTKVGVAYVDRRHSTTSFQYERSYLERPESFSIDPSLSAVAATHHIAGLPGCFQDCSPDRWGRNLISKLSRAKALANGLMPPSLGEIDYLLGVSDLTRQGALRFRLQEDGAFLGSQTNVPKLIELPRLLQAAQLVASSAATSDDDLSAVKELLDAGTGSLGGARPKASVRDHDQLAMAKFPHPNDDWNVMAWEKTVLDLAEHAGLRVPLRQLLSVGGVSVLVLNRFDRVASQRIPYLSAMSLLRRADGDVADYFDIAEGIAELGSNVIGDQHELWARAVFSVAVNNTDDHLRNHGFLRSGNGWRLSPIFDVNPNPTLGADRATGIGGSFNPADALAGLRLLAPLCGVTDTDASAIVQRVLRSTALWKSVAKANGVRTKEIKQFEFAFEALRPALTTF